MWSVEGYWMALQWQVDRAIHPSFEAAHVSSIETDSSDTGSKKGRAGLTLW